MSIKTLPGLTPDGQIYFDEDMHLTEAMQPPGPWKTAHGPGLLETPAGTLLCCWFAGTFEGDTDVNIVVSRLEKGASRWEEPTYISHNDDHSDQNPSLLLAPNGDIWAMYTSQLGRQPGKDNMQYTSVIKRQVSTDDGRTWSEPEGMFGDEGTFARQAIQVLSNGRWIYGLWLCSDSATGLAGDPSAFMVSDDQGATWRRVDMPGSAGRVHPSVVDLGDGHLAAFMRSREADFIYRSESDDYGDIWSVPVPTPLPNNNSGIAALRLASGRVAIAYNPQLRACHLRQEGCLAGAAQPRVRRALGGRWQDLPAYPAHRARRGLRGRREPLQQPPVRVPHAHPGGRRHAAPGLCLPDAAWREVGDALRGRRRGQGPRRGHLQPHLRRGLPLIWRALSA